MTVALLAAVESLLSAVVADGMSGDKHNSNVELMAQGVANLVSPMVGGIPVTGAIARTATNIRCGAKTPVAGIIHALTLLGLLMAAAPLAKFIPLATLAAVLFVVAYNMGEWKQVGAILRLNRAVRMVWAATFLLTVVADLTIAVEVGMTLAALLYIYRVTQTTTVAKVTAGVHRGRPSAHAAGQRYSGVRDDPADPRTVSVRDHREAGRGYGRPERLREGRDFAGTKYDGDRCHRPSRAWKGWRCGFARPDVRCWYAGRGGSREICCCAVISRSISGRRTFCRTSRRRWCVRGRPTRSCRQMRGYKRAWRFQTRE